MTHRSNNSGFTRRRFLGAGLAVSAGFAVSGLPGVASADSNVVTIYAADGLRNGQPNWFDTVFDAFTKQTGIQVQYVEAGSAGVLNRALRERYNTQADVLVTLPPFIQKAANSGVLQAYTPDAAQTIPSGSKGKQGRWYAMVNNYACFIYNTQYLDSPPKTFKDLLKPKFKGKIQYSTPGQAGDGTAFLLEVFHAFGSQKAGLAYLKKLQSNNVGPSSSTGKLAPLTNKGELWAANGDVQMNFAQQRDNPNIKIFWPANSSGERSTFALPYAVGLVKGAPHTENGKKLVDFLLSKQAQTKVSTIAHGLPVRNDIHPSDENYQKLHHLMDGVTIWQPDWSNVAANLQSYVSKWQEATR